MVGIPPSNTGENIIQRRSQRVMLKVSVVVLSQGADDKIISEETRTITVSAHGAMIVLTAPRFGGSPFRRRTGQIEFLKRKATQSCCSPKLRKAMNVVRVTM